MNQEVPDIQAGFIKGRGNRDQIAKIHWIIEKARELQKKKIYFCFNNHAGLKLNIQKTKITPSSPITSWQIDGETMETVGNLIFGAPKSLRIVIAAMKLKDAYFLEAKL